MHQILLRLHEKLLEGRPDLELVRKRYKRSSSAYRIVLFLNIILVVYFIFSGNWPLVFGGIFSLIIIFYLGKYLVPFKVEYDDLIKSMKSENMQSVLNCFAEAKMEYTIAPSNLDFVWGLGLFKTSQDVKPYMIGSDLIEGKRGASQFKILSIDFKNTKKKEFVNLKWRRSTLFCMDYNPQINTDILLVQNGFLASSSGTVINRLKELRKIIEIPNQKNKISIEKKEFNKRFTVFAKNKTRTKSCFSEEFIELLINIDEKLSHRMKFISIKNSQISILVFGDSFLEKNAKVSMKTVNPFYGFYVEVERFLEVLKLNAS